MVRVRRQEMLPARISKAQRKKLRSKSVGILGLDVHGVELASLLSKCGINRLFLADPFPIRPSVIGTIAQPGWKIGEPRHRYLASLIESAAPSIQVETIGDGNLNESDIAALASESDLVVACFDAGFRRPYYSLNRANYGSQRPVLFSEMNEYRALIGPLISAGAGPCYACYRLRRLACAKDYKQAFRDEQQAIEETEPRLAAGPVSRRFALRVARRLLLESLAVLLSSNTTELRGRVIELHAADSKTTTHSFLAICECPVCGTPCAEAPQPDLNMLAAKPTKPINVSRLSAKLISPLTGIVRKCEDVPRQNADRSSPYFCWSQLSNHNHSEYQAADSAFGFGKGLTRKQARESAIGEALETYAGSGNGVSKIVYATRAEIDQPGLNPRDLVLYGDQQYETLSYARYSEDTRLGWVLARSLVSSDLVSVPAIAVFLDYSARSAAELILPPSSNGLATGRSLAEAILVALYEVLERDAFLITWLNRLQTEQIDPTTHPNSRLRALCRTLHRQGVAIRIFKLPTDHSCRVFAAVGHSDHGALPAIAVGLGADLSADAAAQKAILELAQNYDGLIQILHRPGARERMNELAADPGLVVSMDDHRLLYASPAATAAMDFLFESDVTKFEWPRPLPRSNAGKLRQLVSEISAMGRDAYYINMTPNDLSQLGLACVRVIVSHFQPMHFGACGARLGGRRLFDLPVRLGLAEAPKHVWELNKDPHPLG